MPRGEDKKVLYCCFLLLALSLAGCSDPNTKAVVNTDTGQHASGWLPAGHMTAARTDAVVCESCHGSNLQGGISGISCTSCHLGSPSSVHPADWNPVYSAHGPYVKTKTTSSCANQYCHGASLTGVPESGPSCSSCHIGGTTSEHPANWDPVYSAHGPYAKVNGTTTCSSQYCHGPSLAGVPGSGPSCTSCHLGGVTSFHPAEWAGDACTNHGAYAFANGTGGCANAACHGAGLQGVLKSGPSCTQCHPTIPNASSCNTCHGIPPDGAGTIGSVYPNLPGSHAQHMQLSGVTCATCHNRTCDQHIDGVVEVLFGPAYNAETGLASLVTTTGAACSNVSCHGGPRSQQIRTIPAQGIYTQVTSQSTWTSDPAQTPDWYTGSISLNDTNQCFSCHVYGDTLYNGYFSGRHYLHVMEHGITCISCHDTLKLSNISFHFPDLSSQVISTATASASTNSWLNFDGTTCTSQSCHSDTRNWWQ
ncbi:MAG TPA: hypothetical protein VL197_10775 [Nitrospirota bacterium]|nr:hypothetical protein [Nitrospirota bacterium]